MSCLCSVDEQCTIRQLAICKDTVDTTESDVAPKQACCGTVSSLVHRWNKEREREKKTWKTACQQKTQLASNSITEMMKVTGEKTERINDNTELVLRDTLEHKASKIKAT